MTAAAIRHCPFCRGRYPSIEEVDVRTWAVCCPDCGMIGPHDTNNAAGQTPAMAIERWNKRPGEGHGAGVDEALNSGDGVYRP